jgi:hypothetical protein
MAIGGQTSLPAVSVDDIVREAKAWSHPADRAREAALATIAKVTAAIDRETIPPDSGVAIYVRERAGRLMP